MEPTNADKGLHLNDIQLTTPFEQELMQSVDIEPYRGVLSHIEGLLIGLPHDGTAITGFFPDYSYSFRVKGSKSTAVIIEIARTDGSSFSCVLRDPASESRDYMENVKSHPVLAEYMPQLYGFLPTKRGRELAILERLSGLGEEDLPERLRDPEFFYRYVHNAAETFIRISHDRLLMNHDVRLMLGWNLIVNPATAQIKFIEPLSSIPFNATSNKLLGNQVFNELSLLDIDSSNSKFVKTDYGRMMQFIFQLLQKLQQSSEQLEEFYNINSRGFVETLSPAFVEAVTRDEFDSFQKLILDKEYLQDLKDFDDPRYKEFS